jgi:galactofuranose transport system ATP-binding protein
VSHRLQELPRVADSLTVFRDGLQVGTIPMKEASPERIVAMMIGGEWKKSNAAPRASSAVVRLSVRNAVRSHHLDNVSFDLHEGEVLGIAGLLGSGRTETARLLFGVDRADQGTLEIAGKPVRLSSPLDAIQHGLGFCPEDRKSEGIISELSIRENIIIALQCKRGIFRSLSRARQDEIAASYIALLGIKTRDADVPISKLSGGNQQKALLARWLATDPKMLILDEPTRGIDVGAKVEIMAEVMALCDKGMAVVFSSSEMSEILRYSDNVVVMRDRTFVGEMAAATADEQTVFQIIAGA